MGALEARGPCDDAAMTRHDSPPIDASGCAPDGRAGDVAAAAPWLTVIGVMGTNAGQASSDDMRRALQAAELVIGAPRHLEALGIPAEKAMGWPTPFSAVLELLRARRGAPTVVLASGDPLHYGAAASFLSHFTPHEMRVVPAPSSFAHGAAAMRWPLAEVCCVSCHGRDAFDLTIRLRPGGRFLVLTSDGGAPSGLGEALVERGYGQATCTVLENLASSDREAATALNAEALARCETPFSPLNVLAIDCRTVAATVPEYPVVGLPDDAFEHDGQMTKREVRAVTMSALGLMPGARLWDVGAGCGSIAVEWVRQSVCFPPAERLRASAIEPSDDRLAMLERNVQRLAGGGVDVVAGRAPEALAGLPAPDAVFHGGGVADEAIFRACWERLKPGGRLVANAVTLEGEAALMDRHAAFGGELVRIDAAISTAVGRLRALRPRMSVLQWRVTRS